jgi:ribosome maturation factor RimP
MHKQKVSQEELRTLLKPVLQDMQLKIAYLVLSQRGDSPHLSVALEAVDDAPLTLDRCAQASKRISAHLDVADPIAGAYTLEVGSPGLDRPLFTLEDYQRFLGSSVIWTMRHAIEGQKRFHGVIESVHGQNVVFKTDAGEKITSPLVEIHRCKLVPML